MNRHFETPTIRIYDEHAADYVRATVGVNMETLYEPFLSRIPKGGRILDAGCGWGDLKVVPRIIFSEGVFQARDLCHSRALRSNLQCMRVCQIP